MFKQSLSALWWTIWTTAQIILVALYVVLILVLWSLFGSKR